MAKKSFVAATANILEALQHFKGEQPQQHFKVVVRLNTYGIESPARISHPQINVDPGAIKKQFLMDE
ncbi:jg14121 [Pararge aegeria aegeria]|uniref:Jg14121 protein n=1 Tax=Pararge aegeria aegeria TaxID=348720 RepID=A0A8S4RXQ9_9NEOP|nr:jg14121 [Pararge aegeria aegeria]